MVIKKESPAGQRGQSQIQSKDTQINRDTQLRLVHKSFKGYPKSMRQVASELNEERSNICWYVGMLRETNQIAVHHQGECETTGHTVNYYTTDPVFIKRLPRQLDLFNMKGL